MLKTSEIKALSDLLNFHPETTKNCLNILYSENSLTIDNDVVFDKDVDEFLRICIETKSKEERSRLFYDNLLSRCAKKEKLEDAKKAIVYFILDKFFCTLLACFEDIEERDFDRRFDRLILDNLDSFYAASFDLSPYIDIEIKKKRGLLVDWLIGMILEEFDIGDYDCFLEGDFVLKLCTDIARAVGFQMFVSNRIRHEFVDHEELSSQNEILRENADSLLTYGPDTRGDYIFIYCLCETLKKRGYNMEECYKKLSRVLHKASSSIRRRYYDLKADVDKKGLDYKRLIQTHRLDFRINSTIDRMNTIRIS